MYSHYHTTGINSQVIKIQRYNAILGKPWLYQANPLIDWRTNQFTFNYGPKTITVKADSTKPQTSDCNSLFISSTQLAQIKSSEELFAVFLNTEKIKPTTPQPKEIQQLLNKYPNIFPKELPKELPPQRTVDHVLILYQDLNHHLTLSTALF